MQISMLKKGEFRPRRRKNNYKVKVQPDDRLFTNTLNSPLCLCPLVFAPCKPKIKERSDVFVFEVFPASQGDPGTLDLAAMLRY